MPTSIPRERLLNKLRDLHFSFRKKGKWNEIYGRGDGARVSIPTNKLIDTGAVTTILRDAGCADAEIRSFIQSAAC